MVVLLKEVLAQIQTEKIMTEIKKADCLTDHEKLEYIHHVLQECGDANAEWHQIKSALTCVEDIRETFFDKDGNTIPQVTLQTMVESKASGNNHPTVKPVELMKYLVKLVTPEGGKVLDPFCGSGSTGMAAVELDYEFTGCELDPDYVDIATRRITAWKNKTDLNNNPLPEQWFTIGE